MINKNLILTAGHCIVDQSEFYGCKSIIHREQNDSGPDFGIFETDREVVEHIPLALANRKNSILPKGAQLLMIGHPSGLPTKLDDGGRVRDPSPNGFFVATTDSYSGNSGSAVFNQESHFVIKGNCYVSKVCAENACRGEDVTKASSITPFIPTHSSFAATKPR